MVFENKRVAFIGGGMMGTAMISGIIKQGSLEPSQIVVSDPSIQRGEYLTSTFGVTHTTSNTEAVNGADAIVLAVKPQFFDAVATDIHGKVSDATLILSIMAGVTIQTMCEKLDALRVVRSIPNTPSAIGMGITAWIPTEHVEADGLQMTEGILQSMGETLRVPAEHYLDMATAVSGSGPAYVFTFIEAMIDAAVHMGFARADAEKLVLHTVNGSVNYLIQSNEHPAVLRNQVTSPGGTTAEGLYHMEKNGLRSAVARGVWGAYQRSVALGGGKPRNPDTSA